MTTAERNDLIIDHLPLADKLAWCKKKKVPYHVDVDELKSAAYFGLVDAASRFNPKYPSFSGYAAIRITGAIGDFLRELGWGSKCQYNVMLCGDDSPLESWVVSKSDDDLAIFKEIIKNLSESEQRVLFWYYGDNYYMREIGEMMGVSESRISQIILRCKTLLKKQWNREDFVQ